MELSGRILTPGWASAYIDPPVPYKPGGRDRDGLDCWGLLRMVYAEQFGIELPSYSGDYDDPNDGYQIEPAVAAEMPDWVPVSEPKPGDAMLVAMLGFQSHVAVYVEPNRMLHTIEKYDTRIERFDRPAWKRRLRGFYRHLSR